MDVVFMGTPEFAVPSLVMLRQAHHVLAVFTQPDRPSGRGRNLVPSPVKDMALDLGLPVVQPPTLRDKDVWAALETLKPDVICVAAYGLILPPEVLAIPRFGSVNVHASLLPRHRGAAPIERAILEGDDFTGVSIMRIEEGLDTGPFAMQIEIPVGEATATELASTLARVGASGLLQVLVQIENGSVRWVEQDDSLASYAEKMTSADTALAPTLATSDALRRIRASSRRNPARTIVSGTQMTVVAARPSPIDLAPGAVSCGTSGLMLGFADGSLEVTQLVPAGRRLMSGEAWACGARSSDDAVWTAVT